MMYASPPGGDSLGKDSITENAKEIYFDSTAILSRNKTSNDMFVPSLKTIAKAPWAAERE